MANHQDLGLRLRVGLFVGGVLILFMAFVLVIGSQSRVFERRYALRTSFNDVQGLITGAPVRLAGVAVGTVTQIAFSGDPRDPRLRVEMAVDQHFQDRIRADSVATIGTIGLVGDKILEITVGSAGARVLEPEEEVRSVDPRDYTHFVDKGALLLDQVTKTAETLNRVLVGFEGGDTQEDMTATLRSIQRTLGAVEKGPGLLHSLIYGKEGAQLLADLGQAATNLKALTARLEAGEGLVGALTRGDSTLLKTLEADLRKLDQILDAVQRGDGTLHALIYGTEGRSVLKHLEEAATSFQGLAGRLDRVASALERGEGVLGTLLTDPQGKALLTDLKAATASLRAVTGRLERGEGTLGALLEDPTVYEDLSRLLRGAERSALLRSLIRSTIDSGGADNTPPPAQ
ncbi:MAG TPA: MlaD family protein [Candidatus Methylomirabilis sp.]|jgi:phospholipid/cholesterol/gamma-HCH transport system substrate-binding protein|nr:MlaD family protein [Candidatus Methylomirabilis sp.]